MQKARRGGGERVHRGWCGREREGEVGPNQVNDSKKGSNGAAG